MSEKGSRPYRKPRADVYTFMLIVALLAILLGIVCLYFEMKRFNFEFKQVPKVPSAVVVTMPAMPMAAALARLEKP